MHASLSDSPEKLGRVLLGKMSFGPLGPMRGQADGFFHFFFGRWEGEEVVQAHDDIRAQFYLNIHHILWRKENFSPVEMRCEFHTLFFHLDKRGEAVNLKTSAV